MPHPTSHSTLEAAISAYCRARESRPDLSLECWIEEQEAMGVAVPAGTLQFRSSLVSLAHQALHGVPVIEDLPREQAGETDIYGGLKAGARVGEYVLEWFIAHGGMGTVWKGRHEPSGESVALKFIASGYHDTTSLGRFEREALVGQDMQHAGLVRTLAAGVQNGVPWIAMEYIAGERSLETVIREEVKRDLPTASWYEQAAGWLLQVAQALEVMHAAGFVHRDLKPSNVLIDPSGRCKLADFGLVRPVATAELTTSCSRLGTIAYMSPEQVRGEHVDPRSDVFSLGVLLYEMLTLQRPFVGGSPAEVAQSILVDEAENPRTIASEIPTALATVALRALEKAPQKRYENAAAIGTDLELFSRGERILGRAIPRPVRALRWCRRHRVFTSVALMVVLGGLGAWFMVARLQSKNRELLYQEKMIQSAVWTRRIQVLEERLIELNPVEPGLLPALEQWKEEANQASATLEPFVTDSGAMHPGFKQQDLLEDEQGAWHADVQETLQAVLLPGVLDAIDSLQSASGGPLGARITPQFGWGIDRRIDEARRLERLFARGGAIEQRWNDMLVTLEEDVRYTDIGLTMQMGLVPIGKDPASGFQEFWHVLSGAEPRRDADGVIQYRAEDGIVLVLLPAGKFLFGSQGTDPKAKNYDPDSPPKQHAPLEVLIEPFFLSKYELTVSQWERLRGRDPSPNEYRLYCQYNTTVGPTVPVTGVAHGLATRSMEQVGLALPNRFEWEYAARGGTTTTWWTGNDPAMLAIAENLRDMTAFKVRPGVFQEPEPWFDGYTIVARADALLANPFGLHHVHGNVSEWLNREGGLSRPVPVTVESHEDWSKLFFYRGGHYNSSAIASTSAARMYRVAGVAKSVIGIRPARSISR